MEVLEKIVDWKFMVEHEDSNKGVIFIAQSVTRLDLLQSYVSYLGCRLLMKVACFWKLVCCLWVVLLCT